MKLVEEWELAQKRKQGEGNSSLRQIPALTDRRGMKHSRPPIRAPKGGDHRRCVLTADPLVDTSSANHHTTRIAPCYRFSICPWHDPKSGGGVVMDGYGFDPPNG